MKKSWYNNRCCRKADHNETLFTECDTRSSIEVVITSTIGNRVAFTGSRVRIPPTPPEKNTTHLGGVFLLF